MTNLEREFEGRTALITGGASGLGFLCGKTLASKGAKVVLVDIDAQALEDRVAEIQVAGGTALSVAADVRVYGDLVHARDFTVAAFGAIDILINCAGGSAVRVWNRGEEFKDVPIEVYDWGLDVNLKGTFYACHTVLGQMAEQRRGTIINIGSICGEEGSARAVEYATAKSGIMYGLTKSLALYGAQYNVRVCCVAPGPVLTRPGMAKMKTLIGRAAQPEEIVEMILYLASERASFITGTCYLMDGGRSILFEK